MNILTVNTGSSTVRLALLDVGSDAVRRAVSLTFRSEETLPHEGIRKILAGSETASCTAVAHRVVHGGTRFVESCLIDDEVMKEVGRLSVLAPLHNPRALSWIQECRNILGKSIPQIAVFDTAFFASMPENAQLYALPYAMCAEQGIKRYGFHGIAHRDMLRQWKRLRPDLDQGGKMISLQLGSGCSITAVRTGSPVDTSMGFSPLEGLMMSTRCGDVDAGAVLYLQKSEGMSADELETMLNKSSGLLGVSGSGGDMKTLLAAGDKAARRAIGLYCYRAKKYIGAYTAALGGLDGIVFGGGVGEHAPHIREKILEGMQWCGIDIDPELNGDTIESGGKISASSSRVDVRVVPVDESEILAREALDVLKRRT